MVLRRLIAMLNDYDTNRMPAAQRLFLMDEVRAIDRNAAFPTYDAERLAAQFLEADDSRVGAPGLQPTRVPDVWRLAAKGGRVTALYRTATVLAAMRGVLGSAAKA